MCRILCLTLAASGVLALAMPIPGMGEDKKVQTQNVDVSAVVKGNNQFAFDLYRQLAKEAKPDENIFFSPYSISAALAMTYGGGRGGKAAAKARALRTPLGE